MSCTIDACQGVYQINYKIYYMLVLSVSSGARLCRKLPRLLCNHTHQPFPGSRLPSSTSSMTAMAAVMNPETVRRTVRGVVFDMDGTLTVPVIDFQYMRQVCFTLHHAARITYLHSMCSPGRVACETISWTTHTPVGHNVHYCHAACWCGSHW